MTDADVVSLNLRLPAPLHAAIVALARKNDRSLQREIVRLLRERVASEPLKDEA